MAKYSEKLAEKIARLIEEDSYTVSEICNMLGISRKSFYKWKEDKAEFKASLTEAEERRNEKFMVKARKSLKMKLEGYTLIEERITYIPDDNDPSGWKPKSKVIRKKEYAPDDSAIRFVLQGDNGKDSGYKHKETVLNITVQDPKTADMVTFLKESILRNNYLKKGEPETEIDIEPQPTKEIKEVNPEPEEHQPSEKVKDEPVWENVPPGYRRRG